MAIHIVEFGGLAPKITDRRSKPSMADIAENVDLERGTLAPIREPLKVSDATGDTIYVNDCCNIAGDCHSHFIEHGIGCDEIVVATGLEGYPYPVYSKVGDCPPEWKRLGFPCDLPKPTANTLDDVVEDFGMENRSYYYTLVNDMGWESQPSYPSDWIRCNTGKSVVITGINPPVDAKYDSIRIYRTSNTLDYGVKQQDTVEATYLHVGTIERGKTSYMDDTLVAGDACVTEEYAPPPTDLYSIDGWRTGRLIGLSDNAVVMSERGLPHAWNSAYTVLLDQSQPKRLITGNMKAYVLTDGRPFLIKLNGDCDDKRPALDVIDTLEPLPIVSQRSACKYLDGVVYASDAGLVMLNGTTAQIITQDYYTAKQWQQLHPHTMQGVIHDGYYFGITAGGRDNIRFRLPDNIYSSDSVSRLTTISLKPTAMHVSNQGRLYMAFDDNERNGTYEWAQGKQYLPMTWRSTIKVEAGITRYSAWKLIADGDGNTVQHFVDTRPIQTHTNLHTKPVRLPVGHRGLEWQVEIQGINEVVEYHLAPSIRELSLS